MSSTQTESVRREEANHYEAVVNGALTGFTEFSLTSQTITPHP